jgi:hypothetical protein
VARKVKNTDSAPLEGEELQAGAVEALDEGVQRSDGQTEIIETEQKAVQAAIDEYNAARSFDEQARKNYHRDRKYAGGKSDKTWKSNANIIGSHIDILKSFVYAQNPDVSCRPGEKVDQQITEDDVAFAQTMQIVISKLWKRAKLKKRARRQTGATLTTGNGVLKALMYTDKRPNPQMEKQLQDSQDNLKRIQALQVELSEGEFTSEDDRTKKIIELQNQTKGLAARVEKLKVKGLCVDGVRSEDFQCSIDVANIADHLDADWNSDDLYIRKDQLRTRFERLTAADVKSAVTYYQTAPKLEQESRILVDEPRGGDATSADGAFTKARPGQSAAGTTMENGKPVEFARATEMWCRSENIIKTFVDGVKRWAVEPYAPPQGSARFYPYFLLAFYEVDGERHPQSLPEREIKLQDEYASRRSNGAEVRERSVPLKVFNSGMMDPKEAQKITKGQNMELIGLQLTDPQADIGKAVTVLAAPRIDYAAYDTTDVQRDMEIMSGVQEAQQQAPKPGVTATAVETSNQGFASRTGADRDALEDMLTDLAIYTGETALQALTVQDVEKLAGKACYWPGPSDSIDPLTGETVTTPGMDYEDLSEYLDIEIVAGSTGKPQARADKETWATLLPLVQNAMTNIVQLEASGNPTLMAQAKGERALLRETLKRLDDRMSIDQILPPPVAPMIPPVVAGATGEPPGSLPPGAAAGGNPTPLPPVGNGTVNKPQPPPALA